jgi:hypothetical protein
VSAVIRCECGWEHAAERHDDLVEAMREHLAARHPDLREPPSRAAVHAHNDNNHQERPPGQPIELIGAVSPGFVGYLKVDLPAGRYVAACFEADRQSNLVPHTELGMIGHFTID